jgi:hypothetical protein
VGGWRLKVSATLFGLSLLLPLFGVPVVVAPDVSRPPTAAITGGLLLAGEALGTAAISCNV